MVNKASDPAVLLETWLRRQLFIHRWPLAIGARSRANAAGTYPDMHLRNTTGLLVVLQ